MVNVKPTPGLEKKINWTVQDDWWKWRTDVTVMHTEIMRKVVDKLV